MILKKCTLRQKEGDPKMTIIKPQPKQEEFLSNPADIVIY